MTKPSRRGDHSFYDFVKPLDPGAGIMGDGLYSELARTAAFQRLRSVKFLGGIDYIIVPAPNGAKSRYTRFQHSLGVARLALLYARRKDISYSDRRDLYVAAMLHDLGHAPLSHSLEPTFMKHFGIEHHKATEDIIAGRVDLGKQVYDTLKWHSIDVERVLALISGEDDSFDGLFSGPINFDTIEGILRSHSYATSISTLYSPEVITNAAIFRNEESSEDIVDSFWGYKDLMYKTVINSESGVLADFICQHFMELNIGKFSKMDYFTTEEAAFKKMPGLKELLTDKSFVARAYLYAREPVRYRARRFFVDREVPFDSRNDISRYKQTKEPRALLPRHLLEADNKLSKRDLFHDHSLRTQQDFF